MAVIIIDNKKEEIHFFLMRTNFNKISREEIKEELILLPLIVKKILKIL